MVVPIGYIGLTGMSPLGCELVGWRFLVKVGDLVVQLCWEADGAGLVTRIWNAGDGHKYATVQWPAGEVDMYLTQLRVISES